MKSNLLFKEEFNNFICLYRIRSIPFATLRPTFSEIKRVYDQLTKMELYRKIKRSVMTRFYRLDFLAEDYQFQKVEQEKVSISKPKASASKKTTVDSSSESEDEDIGMFVLFFSIRFYDHFK